MIYLVEATMGLGVLWTLGRILNLAGEWLLANCRMNLTTLSPIELPYLLRISNNLSRMVVSGTSSTLLAADQVLFYTR